MKIKYSKASGTGGRKNPKTLSGIETRNQHHQESFGYSAAKTLKPYQGLKPSFAGSEILHNLKAAKTLKPYQGLKQKPLNILRKNI